MLSAYQQYVHADDGTISLKGYPALTVGVIADQGQVTGRDIETELRLPKYREDWEHLAKPRGVSARHCRFVLMDESETRFPGSYRLQPRAVTLPATCFLEFAHRGFLIGIVNIFYLGFIENCEHLQRLGIDIPDGVEGDCIVAQATLFNSPLADAAWMALERRMFTHCCPLILRQNTEPLGTGRLVEVSLTPGDYPGCQHARVLKTWTA